MITHVPHAHPTLSLDFPNPTHHLLRHIMRYHAEDMLNALAISFER